MKSIKIWINLDKNPILYKKIKYYCLLNVVDIRKLNTEIMSDFNQSCKKLDGFALFVNSIQGRFDYIWLNKRNIKLSCKNISSLLY